MAYVVHNFEQGDILYAEQLNEMDAQIALNEQNIEDSVSSDMLAETYSANKTYSVGDYVVYNNDLYVCIYEITAPEGWNPAHWQVSNLGDGISDVKNAIIDEDRFNLYPLTEGKYLLADDTESSNDLLAHTDYIKIPDNAGEINCGGRTSSANGQTYYNINPNVLFYDENKSLILSINATNIDYVTIDIPPQAVYCRINTPSSQAPNGKRLIRFIEKPVKNGYVGTFSYNFTSANTQRWSNIELLANHKYIIVSKTEFSGGRVNVYAQSDGNNYTQVFGKGAYEFTSTSNSRLYVYNGSWYTGLVEFDVYEQGGVDYISRNVSLVYNVGSHYAYTSLTALLLALKDDDREKIIYVEGGEYDIFQEYTDLGLLSGPAPSDPTYDYFDYNVWIPKNTHIIGQGFVRLKWMPTTSDISADWSKTISPVNMAGSATLENVEIHCKNGRYCIHDDPLGSLEYIGARKILKNVKCYKYANDPGYGFAPTIGYGIDNSMYFEFDNCLFDNQNSSSAFYMHDRNATDTLTINKNRSSNVLVNSCIMTTVGSTAVRLGNASTTSEREIRVDFNNCHIGGTILTCDENDSSAGTRRNVYNLTLLHSGNPTITIRDANNEFTPAVYQ